MRRLQTKDPTLVQVLSLYLLLLAFFVVLFNASRLDKGRLDAVGESLTATFKPTEGIAGPARRNTSQEGRLLGDEADLQTLADLVKTELKVAEIRVLRAGRLMQVRLPEDALFAPGTNVVRPEKSKFLAGLAAILGRSPEGRRHKIEMLVGADRVTPDRLTESVPPSIHRAAGLAEALLSRGALPGTVRSGVSLVAPGDVVLLFRIDPDLKPEDVSPADSAGQTP